MRTLSPSMTGEKRSAFINPNIRNRKDERSAAREKADVRNQDPAAPRMAAVLLVRSLVHPGTNQSRSLHRSGWWPALLALHPPHFASADLDRRYGRRSGHSHSFFRSVSADPLLFPGQERRTKPISRLLQHRAVFDCGRTGMASSLIHRSIAEVDAE